MWRRLFAIAIASTLAACRACESAPAPVDVGPKLELELDALRERARVPAIGWAWVTRDSAIEGAVGMADVQAREPAGATTAFEAASIAKTVIASCVMQLVEARKLELDADVSGYVGFAVRHPHFTTPITIRELLTHTASVVDLEETQANGTVPLSDFLGSYFADAGSRGVFLDARPGTKSAYSNAGASLAALAVERVAGVRFDELARRRVFEPLGMTTTAFGRSSLPSSARVARGYSMRGAMFDEAPAPSHALWPVVDLFTTPRDLARFTRAILRGGELDGARILSAESVAAMLRVQLPDAAPAEALGWQLRTIGGRPVVGHEGEDRGASTGVYLDVEAGAGALVLANGDAFQSNDPERGRALESILDVLLGRARTSSRRDGRLRSPDAD
jgi:CubicO group peptidase (beta-lactamase class C family)